MAAIPNPVLLYHITAIDNLPSIFECGSLMCKNDVQRDGIECADIAYQSVQGRRAIKTVPVGPGGTLHDYVPFYFAPRSPMLFTINNGNVEGCDYRQKEIVHVVSSVDSVVDEGYQFVFYDMNAAVGYSTAYEDLDDLMEIDWELFFETPRLGGYCKYWQSRVDQPKYIFRMETRQAEFLVYEQFRCDSVTAIGVIDDQTKQRVEKILAENGYDLPVTVETNWYY